MPVALASTFLFIDCLNLTGHSAHPTTSLFHFFFTTALATFLIQYFLEVLFFSEVGRPNKYTPQKNYLCVSILLLKDHNFQSTVRKTKASSY